MRRRRLEPFSELYECADIRDPEQFNYHLDKLIGQFVTKTENSGYELTEAGRRIEGATWSLRTD